jgi:hypothetical protein
VQNDIELLCEARGSLTNEIKVNSVHRIFRTNCFAIVRLLEKKFVGRENFNC